MLSSQFYDIPSLHDYIISLLIAAGIDHPKDYGVCYGFGMKTLEYSTKNTLKKFTILYEAINYYRQTAPKKLINFIRELKDHQFNQKEILIYKNITLHTIHKFLKTLKILHDPNLFPELFNKKIISQLKSEQVFNAYRSKGKIVKLMSYAGIYKKNELINYYALVHNLAQKYQVKKLSQNINFHNHTVTLIYDNDEHDGLWILVNINLDKLISTNKNDTSLTVATTIVDFLYDSFEENSNHMLGFSTIIYGFDLNYRLAEMTDISNKTKSNVIYLKYYDEHLQYKIAGPNKIKCGDISWNLLPQTFPKDITAIVQQEKKSLSYILPFLGIAGYVKYDLKDCFLQSCQLASALKQSEEYISLHDIKTYEHANRRTPDNCTLVYLAAEIGLTEMIKALVNFNCDLNAMIQNKTALMQAVTNGHTDLVTILLQKKAAPNLCFDSHSPIKCATYYEDKEMVKILLKYNASVNLDDTPPLLISAEKGRADLVEIFIAAKADINHQNSNRRSALMMSCASSHATPEIIKQLIDAKSDITLRTQRGLTALDMAFDEDNKACANVIIDHIRQNMIPLPITVSNDNFHVLQNKYFSFYKKRKNINNDTHSSNKKVDKNLKNITSNKK